MLNIKEWFEERKLKRKMSKSVFKVYKANQRLIHLLEDEVNEYRNALTSLQVEYDELKMQVEFYKNAIDVKSNLNKLGELEYSNENNEVASKYYEEMK